jgi:hypothetical protein
MKIFEAISKYNNLFEEALLKEMKYFVMKAYNTAENRESENAGVES